MGRCDEKKTPPGFFRKLRRKLSAKKGVRDPDALAAWIKRNVQGESACVPRLSDVFGHILRERQDAIKGGLAAGSDPSEFDQEQLRRGTSVEMEHTDDRSIAQEIAMDHLTEDPRYYEKLAKMEKGS